MSDPAKQADVSHASPQLVFDGVAVHDTRHQATGPSEPRWEQVALTFLRGCTVSDVPDDEVHGGT